MINNRFNVVYHLLGLVKLLFYKLKKRIMIKKYHKGGEGKYQKWEHFRVVKKFTILPLKIYQYTSQTTWWSWLETSYILQSWEIDSSIKSYIFGGYWKNERMSDIEEYNDYQNSKQ